MNKKICAFILDNEKSMNVFLKLKDAFEKKGFTLLNKIEENSILNIVIGGDGTFIKAIHESNFPSNTPFIGINTGTLGFFQEIKSEKIYDFVDDFILGNYKVEKINLLEANFLSNSKFNTKKCINDFVIKSKNSDVIHLDVFIDGNHLESFAGDGLIISTTQGSTAYNMSAGGSILYPTLKGYQITALAPIFSKVYRSIQNSIVVPLDAVVKIVAKKDIDKKISFSNDGIEIPNENTREFTFKNSKTYLQKLVFDKNWYWINMKDKFL